MVLIKPAEHKSEKHVSVTGIYPSTFSNIFFWKKIDFSTCPTMKVGSQQADGGAL